MINLTLRVVEYALLSASLAAAVGIIAVSLASLSARDGDVTPPEGPADEDDREVAFSVICTIRSEDRDHVLQRVEEVLQIDGIEEFVIADDTPDGVDGEVETHFDGRLKWYKRANETTRSRRHVSLNIAMEHAENPHLIIMDIDTEDLNPDLASAYDGQPFAVGMVPPSGYSTPFGLFEKVDNDVRQFVYQAGRYRLGLCPNLSGCFYLARKDEISDIKYRSRHEDFHLTIDIYRQGGQITWLNEKVASQDIPDTLSGVVNRRVNWFTIFLSDVATVFRSALQMPTLRRSYGIALYPLVWYFGGYAVLLAAIPAYLLGSFTLWGATMALFFGAYWLAGAVSQRGQTGLPSIALRATHYVAFYFVLLLSLPVLKLTAEETW